MNVCTNDSPRTYNLITKHSQFNHIFTVILDKLLFLVLVEPLKH